jgi:hypothetical protein
VALEELRSSVVERPRRRSFAIGASRAPSTMPLRALRRFSQLPQDAGASPSVDEDLSFARWKAAFHARRLAEQMVAEAQPVASPIVEDNVSSFASPVELIAIRDTSLQVTDDSDVLSPILPSARSVVLDMDAAASPATSLSDAASGRMMIKRVLASHLRLPLSNSPRVRGRSATPSSLPFLAESASHDPTPESRTLSASLAQRAIDAPLSSETEDMAGLGLGIFVEEAQAPLQPAEEWFDAREIIDDDNSSSVQLQGGRTKPVEARPPAFQPHRVDALHQSGHMAKVVVPSKGDASPSLHRRALLGASGISSPVLGAKATGFVLAPRHWNVTGTAANNNKHAAGAKDDKKKASSSNPCPPTPTAARSGVDANAHANSTWSSPQATASPAFANSTNSTPALAQTPTMASLPASPLIVQAAATGAPEQAQQQDAPPPTAAPQQAQGAAGHLTTATMVAASAAGALLLVLACIWAFLARKRRNKRRRHLSGVMRRFDAKHGGGGMNDSGSSLDVVKPAAYDREPKGGWSEKAMLASSSSGIDSAAYFSANKPPTSCSEELTVITPWMLGEDGKPVGSRISTDLARSGLVCASPSKDATFSWQHPTLSLPPAAARALVTSHYVKKRTTLPAKAAAAAAANGNGLSTASSPNLSSAGSSPTFPAPVAQDTPAHTAPSSVAGADDTLAYASSAYIDPGLPSAASAPAVASLRSGPVAYAAPESVSASSNSTDNRAPWLSNFLRGLRQTTSTPPRDRASMVISPPHSLPSVSSASMAGQATPPASYTSGSDSGIVHFVTERASGPVTSSASVFGGSEARHIVSSSTGKGRARSSTLTQPGRISLAALPAPAKSSSIELPRAAKSSAPLVIVSRPSEILSGGTRRLSNWRTSLSTCREDSRDSLAQAAAAPAAERPGNMRQGTFGPSWAALQPRSDFDSSEDEMRQGYEAGEETDGELPSTLFSVRYLTQRPPSVPSSAATATTSSGPSMPPTPTKPSLSSSSSPNGVHKRAPRLPPMPLITLTLDDGLVQRPLSLTSDSSDDEPAPITPTSATRPPSAVSQTRLALQSVDTMDELSDLAYKTAPSDGRLSRASLRHSRELLPDDDGYGSDSAEGCLEADDFPTLPAWTPMTTGRRPSY